MILEPPESVQKLQAALQAKAKGSPGYRFYLLYDKLDRKDVLEYAYRCADRTVMTAAVSMLAPIFEADMRVEQHAYRANFSAHSAVRSVRSLINTGHKQIVEGDLGCHPGQDRSSQSLHRAEDQGELLCETLPPPGTPSSRS
jgi:hypothetical protein